MGQIRKTGYNNEALTATGTEMRELISGLTIDTADPDAVGRVFLLKWLVFSNEHASAAGVVELADQDEAALTPDNQRGAFIAPPSNTRFIEFPDPGLEFFINLTAGVDAGTFSAYSQLAGGWLVD